jgi:hypothetical protein
MAAASLRYDVVVDVSSKLLRVQVKSTAGQIYEYGHKNPTYKFNLAKGPRSKLISSTEVDVVALVATDTGEIAYLLPSACPGKTIKLRPADAPTNVWSKRNNIINQLPFSNVLKEIAA